MAGNWARTECLPGGADVMVGERRALTIADLRRSGGLMQASCDCGQIEKIDVRRTVTHGNVRVDAAHRRFICRNCHRPMRQSRAVEDRES